MLILNDIHTYWFGVLLKVAMLLTPIANISKKMKTNHKNPNNICLDSKINIKLATTAISRTISQQQNSNRFVNGIAVYRLCYPFVIKYIHYCSYLWVDVLAVYRLTIHDSQRSLTILTLQWPVSICFLSLDLPVRFVYLFSHRILAISKYNYMEKRSRN